jgi:Tol biopolymer transport system component
MRHIATTIGLMAILALAACTGATDSVDPSAQDNPPPSSNTPAPTATITPTPEPTPFSGSAERRIIFSGHLPGEENAQIYSILPDGTSLQQLSDNADDASLPRWSPDGEMVAYYVTLDGQDSLYVMNADGSEQTKLAEIPSGYRSITGWSADSRWLYLTNLKIENLGDQDVLAIDPTTGDTQELAGRPWSWSPDGNLAIGRLDDADDPCGELFLMDSDNTILDTISITAVCVAPYGWSPDGTSFIYRLQAEPDSPWQVYVASADGSNPVNVSAGSEGTAGEPYWTPDGARIIFTITRTDGSGQAFYRVRPDGSDLQQFTFEDDPLYFAAWSPSRTHGLMHTIRYAENTYTSQVFLLDLASWELSPITDGSHFDLPVEFSPDGRWILLWSNSKATHELPYGNFLLSIDGSEWISLNEVFQPDSHGFWQP